MGRRWLVAAVVSSLVAAGCGGNGEGGAPSGEAGGVTVVTAFYPLAWATEAIGGAHVSVTNLTPVGVDPHDLELDPDQRDAIEDADVVIVMGNGFQPGVEAAASDRADTTVVVFSELGSVDSEGRRVVEDGPDEAGPDEAGPDEAGPDEDGSGEIDLEETLDPHVWLDPVLMAEVVEVVERALAEVAPDEAGVFAANADALARELALLHEEHAAALESCASRALVTAHDAFGYLTERYGLEAHGVAGLAPDEEPDPSRLADLADLVEAEDVTVVFTEELVSPAIAEALASEAGVETDVLSTLEALTPEAEERGEDYLSVMRSNLGRISDALGCT